MIQVSIPVHPLTLRVLRAEYGPGPIVMSNHDPLFTFITCSPLRHRTKQTTDLLSSEVTFQVEDRLARHLHKNSWIVGYSLLKLHKMELCKFAAAAVMLGNKGGAKSALYTWLRSMDVCEDEYSLETAYKLWQRFGWKINESKSGTFSGQIRGKAAEFLSGKRRRVPKKSRVICRRTYTLSEIEIELAAHRFSKAVEQCFSRAPKKLAGHARIYYYSTYTHLTSREIGHRLGIAFQRVCDATKIIRIKANKNITLQRMLAAALPDVATPPTPSGHGTSITRNRAQVHSDSRVAQAAGLNRPG